MEVTDNAAFANAALRQALARRTMDSARDKAFITDIVNTTLRNLLRIDALLDTVSDTPVHKMKPYVRAVLRTGVCQLKFMDRVPPSAAVNEAVCLAKARGFRTLGGFVNGVLRSLARLPEDSADCTHFSYTYSYPQWLANELTNWLGDERAHLFCENSHKPPQVSIVTNLLKTTTFTLAARLRQEGAECEPGVLYPEALRLRHTSDITKLPSFREGLFQVMDEGALAAVKALGLKPGYKFLDLCAAPGGKSFACAMLMRDEVYIQAFDVRPAKIAALAETAGLLGIHRFTAAAGDATVLNPKLVKTADVVLLDAPCSGLGVIRKRPEIKYNRQHADIINLAAVQADMLDTAAAYVKPGGVLVYCTCTVAREENIENIRRFTAKHPFAVATPPPTAWLGENNAHAHFYVEENCLQLLPGPYNDGFFIAKLLRKK
jgi:16S rRNA (cytosine967-C5)-methyltransferase